MNDIRFVIIICEITKIVEKLLLSNLKLSLRIIFSFLCVLQTSGKQMATSLISQMDHQRNKTRSFDQGGRGHLVFYYTSLQSLIITFSNLLA